MSIWMLNTLSSKGEKPPILPSAQNPFVIIRPRTSTENLPFKIFAVGFIVALVRFAIYASNLPK